MTQQEIYPWGTFDIDDATGLPKLPEDDLFFRVVNYKNTPHWAVELRRRGRWRSRKTSFRGVYRNEERAICPKNVLNGAGYVVREYLKSQDPENVNDFSLVGDYPHKKLEKK